MTSGPSTRSRRSLRRHADAGSARYELPVVSPRLSQSLLSWFRRNQRLLPWRADRNPYRIWVSEVMLQQTQVATVIPYFERFLQAFPTLAHLAAADLQDVLRYWEGLGYYRRARDLHRAAQILASRRQFPTEPHELQGVPGMGRYTVNAVLSQAFDRRLPILEANSVRVLCRLFGRTEDPARNPLRKWLWQAAEELLPAKNVGEFNQAIMELGALVCEPVAPACDRCPIRRFCAARMKGMQDAIPLRRKPPVQQTVQEVAIVPRRGDRVLLVQRPAIASRWANLWEFPHGELRDGETHQSAARRFLKELTGLEARALAELMTVRHTVTRFAITMVCMEARCTGGRFRSSFYQRGKWLTLVELAEFPLSSPQRRLVGRISNLSASERNGSK